MDEDDKTRPTIVEDEVAEIIITPREGGDDDEESSHIAVPEEVAILAVRNIVVFPGTVVPLAVGRQKSRLLLNSVLPEEKVIVTICQKDPEEDDPGYDDLYEVGTAVMVLKLLKMDEGNQNVIIHGLARVRVVEWLGTEPYLRARVEVLNEITEEDKETDALLINVQNQARQVIQLSTNIPDEAMVVLNNIIDPGPLSDFLASNLQMDLPGKQLLLEELDVNQRLRKTSVELQKQVEVLELSNKIQKQVRANIDKSQREYFLQEQLKAIQKELGQVDEKSEEIAQLRKQVVHAHMPEMIETEVRRDIGRLENIPTASPEHNVLRTYLDVMTELPWSKSSEDKLDVKRARKILDEDHYGLNKVKRRILEYLAVRKLAPDSRGPILCFVGPPGVGKTSLGKSIARAMGRQFIRMSLGGMRDEAELRGHRRTYIGAMPGRIIQEIRKAGTNNPVFMLDELDKVGTDFRGDPTSALLEILDPAQNQTFQDHYLNVPFDLRKVLFIGTANYMAPVPPALRDRMEVIELPGYTQNEKLQIARKYLVPRQLRENGLKASQAKWNDEAINKVIQNYTREAGVRELERQIGTICRAIAALVAGGRVRTRTVTPRFIISVLGPRKYESELALRTSSPGVATGLAYTPSGGEIIFIEAASYPGKGVLTLTGQIGDVMRESVQAAYSLVKSRAPDMGITSEYLAETDIHVHVPAGAVPKDGPSAGVAMFTALTSMIIDRAVRADVAMTGEITLRGLVLPVGGIKEKVLAAKRAGIKMVVIPDRNRKDLIDVPKDARDSLEFRFAKTVDDVLNVALDGRAPHGKKKVKTNRRKC